MWRLRYRLCISPMPRLIMCPRSLSCPTSQPMTLCRNLKSKIPSPPGRGEKCVIIKNKIHGNQARPLAIRKIQKSKCRIPSHVQTVPEMQSQPVQWERGLRSHRHRCGGSLPIATQFLPFRKIQLRRRRQDKQRCPPYRLFRKPMNGCFPIRA